MSIEAAARNVEYANAAAFRLELPRGPGPTGPTIVMLHGLGGDKTQLWPAAGDIEHLPRLALDLRAHGDTAYVGDVSAFEFDSLAADVVALLDRLEVDTALLVGVSMGAGIAVNLALRAADRVAGLALVRPAWSHVSPPPHLAELVEIGRLLEQHPVAIAKGRYRTTPGFRAIESQSPAAAASLLRQFDGPQVRQRSVRLRATPFSVPFPDYACLHAISIPALVIGAIQDPLHPEVLAHEHAAELPNAQLGILPSRDSDAAEYERLLATMIQEFIQRTGSENMGL
jgi:pimeloyl-ACP methyl ester carboxylesterase